MFKESVFELSYISVLILVITLLLFWTVTKRTSRLPPGPVALPIIGNLFNVDIKDLVTTYDRMRQKYGDIFCVRIGSQVTVVISGYQNIREAFVKNADAFSDRPQVYLFQTAKKNLGISGTSGNLWKEQRLFTLHTLRDFGFQNRSLETRIMEEVGIFLEALEQTHGQPYNVRHLAKVSVSNIICSIIFGYTHDHRDPEVKKILESIDRTFKLTGLSAVLNLFPILRYLPGDPFKSKEFFDTAEISQKLMLQTVQEHKDTFDENNIRDFIDAYLKEMKLLEGCQNHFFSEEQLVETIDDLFAAGTEATVESIVWAILYLIYNPDVQDKMRSEMEENVGTCRFPSMEDKTKLPYCEAVINEALRMGELSPFGGPRSISQDISFKGYIIPKGTMVLANVHSVMQDPEIFQNPDKFDPTRFLNKNGRFQTKEEFIPFGCGRRTCIGEKLARMELFLFVTALVQRFALLPENNKTMPSLEGTFALMRTAKPFVFCAVKCL